MKFIIIVCALFVRSCTSDVLETSLNVSRQEEPAEVDASILEDARLLVPDLIKKYGYPSEIHTLTTKDGYVLEMHRIPHGKKGPSKNRPAVFVQHGLLCSSADWVLTGPDNGFAYMLADSGYDVWMGNVRGNRYSRKHITLDPDRNARKFWDFTWHEIGTIDVPTMIDYVTAYTKQEQIFYIGHSQGTTAFFVMASERPEYNKKIRAMFALAPVAFMRWMTSPLLRTMALFEPLVGAFASMVGLYEFLPHTELLGSVTYTLCGDDSIFQVLCTNTLFALCGFNRKQLNATILPVLTGHTPAGASTYQVRHYGQEVNSGQFRQWDYGMFTNLNKYGSMWPPKYNLKKVKAPVYLHYSRNDWLSHEKDVKRLAKKLPNLKGKFLSPDNKFNHLDYIFGMDAPDLLYLRVLGLMKRH